ncbi:hypothetical protein DEJ33_05010 [Curtobacterium sp. MCPF17_047]|uniref:competence protein CoiA family protein n=1 Tax=unclassified Curtobacterium TaxID=257496 RepID=UPI000DAAB752|nr:MULTISPECIES: competence protein CoiA family protein [unclassified Curtobacterium]PZE60349.1 hypothetical protein DEJ24_06405 [Curtobacterium sp. MCPF17_001]PZF67821.1 hypothetical protein DEJ33_05010 [Curtobacterium sp. MCPF17_047]
MEQSFVFDHAALLAAFQKDGDPRFLWGLDRSTGGLFYLEDNQAHERRDHVVANVTCPVPGCDAQLTTVHSTVKRDHLRHLSSAGGHGHESLSHSQGCALIEEWLRLKYPQCRVKREEYISPEGESRADVLITHPSGERVAFEVQYSPLTADAWNERHERYRARGVRDVWLFGHTRKQLKLDNAGRLQSNPALAAVAATGVPLLFINPEARQVALATSWVSSFSAEIGAVTLPPDVPVLGGADGAVLEVYPLKHFRLGRPALTSDRIAWLLDNARELPVYNERQRQLYAERLERDRLREQARRAQQAEQWGRGRKRREAQVEAIRTALQVIAPWNTSHPAVPLIEQFLDGRRPRDLGRTGNLEQWKCIAYFFHIAGQLEVRFGVKDVADSLYRHRIQLGQGTYKTIGRWLNELVYEEFLYEGRGTDGFPIYKPHFTGTWWWPHVRPSVRWARELRRTRPFNPRPCCARGAGPTPAPGARHHRD